ncbi:FecR family protein [Pseudomonas sp. SIMBA_067]|uniref:FecR family protein n=1 Tax=Pseudomonas sp. SIMBA_067 TaxID=3085807 RepID=UPI003979E7B6
MNVPDSQATQSALREQALQWLVDLHSGDKQKVDWEGYLQWCETSPGHQRAAQAAERLWEQLGSALQCPVSRPQRLPVLGLVLAVGLACGLTWQAAENGWMADQRTGVGERRTLQLADGSRLELAPQTRVDVDVDGSRRVLRLYSGELYVQVAADPKRPFDVEAGEGRMRALGTAFDVRRQDSSVHLVVTEHAVRVDVQANDAVQTAEVQEGQALDYDDNGVSQPYAVDASAETAWLHDRLVFNNRTLGDVLDAMKPYHSGLIWIRDAELRQLPVTGIVGTNDLPAQLQLLQRSLPVRIRQLPWLTLIERDNTRVRVSR